MEQRNPVLVVVVIRASYECMILLAVKEVLKHYCSAIPREYFNIYKKKIVWATKGKCTTATKYMQLHGLTIQC